MEDLKQLGSCSAVIFKVATSTDGGVRVQLDIDGSQEDLIQALIRLKLNNKSVFVAFVEEVEDY